MRLSRNHHGYRPGPIDLQLHLDRAYKRLNDNFRLIIRKWNLSHIVHKPVPSVSSSGPLTIGISPLYKNALHARFLTASISSCWWPSNRNFAGLGRVFSRLL